MNYRQFQTKENISLFGFGTLRLPKQTTGVIDSVTFEKMAMYAIEHGVNYFDTAYAYAGGKAELELGKILKKSIVILLI